MTEVARYHPFQEEEKTRPLTNEEMSLIVKGAILLGFMLLGAVLKLKFPEVPASGQDMRKKLKYFVPTVTENQFGKKITWTGRQVPLTDDQVDELMSIKP